MSTPAKPDPRRYGTTTVRVRDLKVCYYCKSSPLDESIVYCPSCGFPQRGTELEQKRFLVGRKQKHKDVNETEASIGVARVVLYGMGVLNGGIAAWFYHLDIKQEAVTQGIVAAIYIGLGLWAGKKPFPALLAGLILYGTFLLLSIIIHPSSIFNGLLMKMLIISSLIYGMRAVKKADDMRKQLEVQQMDLSAAPEKQNENL